MYKEYIKRLFDIILSLLFIAVLSPVFLVIAFITFLELGSPIVFKQYRTGKENKDFLIYKFRTMNFNEDENRDERMTKVTKIIDKYRLNELPQFFNVLKGDMSIVGPRPFYKRKLCNERFFLKPGMTGLAQINGGRHISHEKKLEYDKIYYEKLSFLLDLKVFLATPFSILKDLRK